MARLNVQAAVRWAGDTPDETGPDAFRNTPMLLAIAVTDGDGVGVDLNANEIHVGYQHTVEASEDSIAVVSDFHGNGPSFGDTRWHSCTVSPQPTDSFGQDEVFLYVTVRRGQDRGQALVLARFRQRVAGVRADVRDVRADVRGLQDDVRADVRGLQDDVRADLRGLQEAITRVDNRALHLENVIDGLGRCVAKLPSGITAVNALGQIMATLEEIK